MRSGSGSGHLVPSKRGSQGLAGVSRRLCGLLTGSNRRLVLGSGRIGLQFMPVASWTPHRILQHAHRAPEVPVLNQTALTFPSQLEGKYSWPSGSAGDPCGCPNPGHAGPLDKRLASFQVTFSPPPVYLGSSGDYMCGLTPCQSI